MTDHSQHQVDIHDMVTELTRTHTHRERYTANDSGTLWSRQHVTSVPSLVRQLLGATPAGSGEEAGSATAKSKPAARIEALDTIMLIDDEAARWVRKLGHDDPGDHLDPTTGTSDSGSGTIACIRLVHALHAGLPTGKQHKARRDGVHWCCSRHHIEHDVRRWWHQARIITGWDSLAWRPDNTCPVCEQRRTLRINLTMQAGFCVECRTIWDPTEIGLLAEHVRTENADQVAAS